MAYPFRNYTPKRTYKKSHADYHTYKSFLEIDFCKKCEFSKIHVFPYSKREGTAADKMDNQLDNSIKKERARRLIKIDEELQLNYNKKFLNDLYI